jgi:hypothetical protein
MSAFTSFLSTVLSEGWMRDQEHASKLYRADGVYDFAPKTAWIYYVTFQINNNVLGAASGSAQVANKFFISQSWKNRMYDGNTIGQLVKSADLPKFNLSTETLNQYNRKTQVTTKLEYLPLNITFHDDQANATSDLWFAYYNYMFADGYYSPANSPGNQGYISNTQQLYYNSDNKYFGDPARYGYDPQNKYPFFDSITIYLMNKQKYYSFTLINPIIKEWKHGDVDQNQGNKFLENKMTLAYETVAYDKGNTGNIKPAFNKTHYDTTPSPLAIAGGGSSSLFGAGGVVAGATGIFGANGSFSAALSSNDPWAFAKVAIQTANLAKNVSNLNTAATVNELTNQGLAQLNSIATSAKSGSSVIPPGFSFPGVGFNGGAPTNTAKPSNITYNKV